MKTLTREEVEQQDLAHKYLHGRLSQEQAVAFETFLMDNNDMVEQLQIDGLLQTHVKKVPVSKPTVRQAWHQLMGKPLTYACTFLLAFVLGVFVNPKLLPEQEVGLQGNIEIAYVSSLRGDTESPDSVVSLDDQIDTLLLVLQPTSSQKLDYLVTVTEQNNKLVLIDNARYSSNDLGEIKLPVGKSRLHPGLIKIDFAPVSNPTLTESLVVKLTR